MSQLYLVRHGQTLFNVLRRKQGWCDSPLTEVGIEPPARRCASAVSPSITSTPLPPSAPATRSRLCSKSSVSRAHRTSV